MVGTVKQGQRLITILFLFFWCVFSSVPVEASLIKPHITAQSAVIIDYKTGRILYSKNRNVCRYPASTLKLLTAITALDKYPVTKRFSVSRKASLAEPSKVFLRKGETYTLGDLIKALLISSANDAAICIAEGAGGTEYRFARQMTATARQFGCRHSNFTNASGLPDKNQYTTAYDMARVMKAAHQYPFIRKCLETQSTSIRRPNGQRIRLKNHNKLLNGYPVAVYGKTGYTQAARHCFACVARYRHKQVVMVMLKANTNWTNVKRLVNYGTGYRPPKASLVKKIRHNNKRYSKRHTKRIQQALRKAGFNPGQVDGVFGTRTVRAIMRFQQVHGLCCDGIIGPQTLRALETYM